MDFSPLSSLWAVPVGRISDMPTLRAFTEVIDNAQGTLQRGRLRSGQSINQLLEHLVQPVMDSPTLNIVPVMLICLVHLDNVRNLSNALFKSALFSAYHSLGYTRFFFFLNR